MKKLDAYLRRVAAVKVITYCGVACDMMQNLHGYIQDDTILKQVVIIQKLILSLADDFRKEARL